MRSLCLDVSLNGLLLSGAVKANWQTEDTAGNGCVSDITGSVLQGHELPDQSRAVNLQTVVVDQQRCIIQLVFS